MSTQALLFLAAVGSVLALIAWAASTIRTDPRGYTHVATFTSDHEVKRARELLERAGIAVRLDDHSYRFRWSSQVGTIRMLVATERVADASKLLRDHVADTDAEASRRRFKVV